MKALLIIDMQKGSFTPATPRYNSKLVIDRINKISMQFRSKNLPVIFIQHDGSRFNEYVPQTTEWEILDEMIIEDTDLIVSKTVNGAFYKSELDKVLKENNIDELYITGCATDFCVEATVQAALTHNYNLTIVKDAHTTADRPFVKAKNLIDHYNFIWENLTPTEGTIRLIETAEIIQK